MIDEFTLQRKEVFSVMKDGHWRTLMQLDYLLGHKFLTTSISARLRDFRKTQYGGYQVERRAMGDSTRTFEYRLLPPAPRIEPHQESLFEAAR